MNLLQAIAKANELRDNDISDELKAEWLDNLDLEIGEMMQRTPPTGTFPEDRELLFPAPHSRVYVLYLASQISYYLGETDSYLNDRDAYEAAKDEAGSWWLRNHRPAHNGEWKVGL